MWLSLLFGALKIIPGLAGKFLDWQVQRANIDLEGFKTAGGYDLAAYQAYLSAQVETNRMKLASNGWWGAKVIILGAGLPCAAHFGSVFADSLPWFGHEVGSWAIPKVPAPYDTYEWAIVQSFFIVMPVMPIANSVSAWLSRKR